MLDKNNFKLVKIFIIGWLVFGLIEIVVRLMDQITSPWYRDSLILSVYVLILLAYGIVGIITGLIIRFAYQVVLKWPKATRLKEINIQLAICQTLIISLFLGYSLYDVQKYRDFLYVGGTLAFIVSIFCLLNTFFKKRAASPNLLADFVCSSLVLDILVVGGVYVFKIVVEDKWNPIKENIGMLLGACFLILLFYYKVIPLGLAPLLKVGHSLRKRQIIVSLSLVTLLILSVFSFKFFYRSKIDHTIEDESKPNVIVITLDTTRADHLSCYEYEKNTSPNLDALAAEGILFQNAYSTSSWTLPAHASLFTGLYPSSHGTHTSGSPVLGAEHLTLAEILSQQGYQTAGVIGGHFCSSYFGMDQGFDFYDENLIDLFVEFENFTILKVYKFLFDVNKDFFEMHGLIGKRIGTQINRPAINWLKKNHKSPFFLFLNYFDPHHPYIPLEPLEFPTFNELQIKKGHYLKWEHGLIQDIISKKSTLKKREKEFLLERYDADIKQMDQALGELLSTLKKLGVYDNSIIVVTADHGESFGEHDLMTHMPALYEELVKVPLIVKYPKQYNKTGHFTGRVSIVDIMPEILNTLGINIPQNIQGAPFYQRTTNVLAERPKDNSWKRTAHKFEERSLVVLYDGNYKFIWASNNNHELYNLKEDPQELNNLLNQMPEMASAMETKLKQLIKLPLNESQSSEKTSPVSKEVKEALKALGYVQ